MSPPLPTPEDIAILIEENSAFPKIDRFVCRSIILLRDAQLVRRLREELNRHDKRISPFHDRLMQLINELEGGQ